MFSSCFDTGQSLVCFSCHDSENKSSCKRRLDGVDCSQSAEFGDHFDSCFSMTAINGHKKIQIKDCAIGYACNELEGILCKDYQKEQNYTCKVYCCNGDYCNEFDVGEVSSTGSLLIGHNILWAIFAIACCFLVSP